MANRAGNKCPAIPAPRARHGRAQPSEGRRRFRSLPGHPRLRCRHARKDVDARDSPGMTMTDDDIRIGHEVFQKIISKLRKLLLRPTQISRKYQPSRPTKGALRNVNNAGRDAVDARGCFRRGHFLADGKDVWSWHLDAGVKFVRRNFHGRRWPKSPSTGEGTL
jgi:hypothetical protein